ncbi:CGNR zinc finger domain-containing protein [Belliella pelovolcani]|uniref:Putative stress-induced transcription regulator n=1 Tax=Belliella pelovolcani TaxID=529505 RepID=A0A1N7PNV7_9BACT|nr:CGNR zinc finger domain-containing protein [Belliella pelovolcani]SIT12160.1 Putative stress-induced transcription regulator [Belliella pelovolcani]
MQNHTRVEQLNPNHIPDMPIIGGNLALDFINTVEHWNMGPYKEYLAIVPDWVDWLKRQQLIDNNQKISGGEKELSLIRKQRNQLYSIVKNYLDNQSIHSSDLSLINQRLQDAYSNRLTVFENERFIYKWSYDPEKALSYLQPIFISLKSLLHKLPSKRLKACSECGWLFWDNTRSSTKKWCDMKFCGSRSKSREHYHRKKKNS